jgi:hypothetical protein
MLRNRILVLAALAGAIGLLLAPSRGQDSGAPKHGAQVPAAADGDALVKVLLQSPGCLGVETAFTRSRKSAIFAWFKDKESTLDWYYGDFHQTAMMELREAAQAAEASGGAEFAVDGQEPELQASEPLAHVKDDVGPILCIATITPSAPGGKQLVPGFGSPISQISIELYAPLPGGIAFNGRFSPPALQVPHMVELAPPQEQEPASPPERPGSVR